MKRILWTAVVILVVVGIAGAWERRKHETEVVIPISNFAEGSSPDGFARADGVRDWEFPADFGAHPEFQTEWWYYTGNLVSDSGQRYGYQLTFFRRGLLPPQEFTVRDSRWAANQVYMGHFALSDIEGEQHYFFERFSRGGAGLSGAQGIPFQVWLENWQVEKIGEGWYRLQASQGNVSIDLTLQDTKGPILNGDGGYSRKGPEAGNASYYFSQTHLATQGVVGVHGDEFPVSGLSWMDHEFSTSALSAGQVGWDWFSLQLSDGSDLMVFLIRRSDGSIDPFSSGTLVKPDGENVHLSREQFEITALSTWKSPYSGAQYPASWRVDVPSLDLFLEIEPYLDDQEVSGVYTYWEGAVGIRGTYSGKAVTGSGYVELTGYTISMEGEF